MRPSTPSSCRDTSTRCCTAPTSTRSFRRCSPRGNSPPSCGGVYAAAVVTWATPATALLAVRSGAPLRVGQARRLYSFLFNRRVVVRSELGDEKTHWSEILLDYPRALGCETALPWPRFEIRTEEEAEADELLRALAVKGEFIALHPVSA